MEFNYCYWDLFRRLFLGRCVLSVIASNGCLVGPAWPCQLGTPRLSSRTLSLPRSILPKAQTTNFRCWTVSSLLPLYLFVNVLEITVAGHSSINTAKEINAAVAKPWWQAAAA